MADDELVLGKNAECTQEQNAKLIPEEIEEPAAAEEQVAYVEPWRQSATPTIYVCVGGACTQDGSHTTLAEIEDLVAASGGGCKVETDWCFGRCGAGPNTLVVNDGHDRFLTGMRSLEDSISAVKLAMGQRPTLDVELEGKLEEMRRVHALEKELSGAEMLIHCSACTSDDAHYDRHLTNALAKTDKVIAKAGAAHPLLQAQHLRRQIVALRSKGRTPDIDILDCTWERVACWRLEAVEPRSKWSAVYTFSSSDAARVQGSKRSQCGSASVSRGATAANGGASGASGASGAARTWHVTLRAELHPVPVPVPVVGGGGPSMPEVVERDYTPLSTEDELKHGILRLLIKIYPEGKATQHLKAQPEGTHLWFSPPKTTLVLPTLLPPLPAQRRVEAFYPGLSAEPYAALDFSSIVLVAGGTGIAPMWQILEQAKAGAGAAGMLSALPLTLLYSCRADDALLLDELAARVAECALMRVFVAVTDAAGAAAGTFTVPTPNIDAGRYGGALSISHGRITQALIAEALQRHLGDAAAMARSEPPANHNGQQQLGPRVVVCGPADFGVEMGALLSHAGVSRAATVTLQA